MKQTCKQNASQKKRKRRFWLIPVTLVLLLAIGGAAGFISDMPSRQELQALAIGSVDFHNLKDGTYVGSFIGEKGNLRDATVEIAVTDGVVTDLRILKGAVDENGVPVDLGDGRSAYGLLENALAQKSMQVDVVSGATLTSKAHLKALENALLQAQSTSPNNETRR